MRKSVSFPAAAFLLILALALASAPASASSLIRREMTLHQARELLSREGYRPEADEQSGVCHFKIMGYRAQLFVLDGGESLQFHCGWTSTDATLRRVNAWNQGKRFSRAYIDDDGDPHLELDLDLAGGVTDDRVVDFLKTCLASLEAFVKEVI